MDDVSPWPPAQGLRVSRRRLWGSDSLDHLSHRRSCCVSRAVPRRRDDMEFAVFKWPCGRCSKFPIARLPQRVALLRTGALPRLGGPVAVAIAQKLAPSVRWDPD